MANLGVILTDAAAWVWSMGSPAAPWLRLDASADGHAALLRWLGQHSGELRCHVLVDLSGETLCHTRTPALSWFNRRALARVQRSQWFAADGVASLRWLPRQGQQDGLSGCGVIPSAPLLTWLHLLASSQAGVASLHSATLLGLRLLNQLALPASSVLLLHPAVDGMRISWQHHGVPQLTRRLVWADETAACPLLNQELLRILGFLASQRQYADSQPPSVLLVATDPAQLAQWAALPALAGCKLQGSTLAELAGAASVRAWLAQHLGRDVGDYALPPGFAHHRLWQCGQRMRQAALATGLISLLAGAGLFGYSDHLHQLSHTLHRRSLALEQADQQHSQHLPALATLQARQHSVDGLLALHQHWPRYHDALKRLPALLAELPGWRLQTLHWSTALPPTQLPLAKLRLTLVPAAEADYRHSVTQLEHALARQRHQGVGATLIQAPHDIQPDGILRPERTGRGGFVLQLTLPATPWRAP